MPNPRWLDEVTQADAQTMKEIHPLDRTDAQRDRHNLLLLVEKLTGALHLLVAALEDDDEDIDDRRAFHGAMKCVDDALAMADAAQPPTEGK